MYAAWFYYLTITFMSAAFAIPFFSAVALADQFWIHTGITWQDHCGAALIIVLVKGLVHILICMLVDRRTAPSPRWSLEADIIANVGSCLIAFSCAYGIFYGAWGIGFGLILGAMYAVASLLYLRPWSITISDEEAQEKMREVLRRVERDHPTPTL
ncbi:MAG: hypothetical protein ACRCWS_02910, partial [Propionibacteriaceae bacterium]